ncbi:hypothetical protein ACKKBF_B10430 [Auxenochlorella protothecoides x Auxenochlorella symbiontica]
MAAQLVHSQSAPLVPCSPWGVWRSQNHKFFIRSSVVHDSRSSTAPRAGRRKLVLVPASRSPLGRSVAPRRRAPALAAVPKAQGALDFINSNVTPLALISALLIGWHFPAYGAAAAGRNLAPLSTAGMFFLSGLLLNSGEVGDALRCPAALAYGLTAVLGLTSALAPLVLRLPLAPPELAIGFAVFCCMPTTLSTGVVLTQAVRGNAAVALMLTVSSNLLSVLSVPLLLRWVLGSAAGAASFSPLAICLGLARTVVAPLLAGVAVQLAVPGVPAWRAARRRQLSYLSAGLLAFIPWMQISRAAAGRLPLGPGTLASAAATGLGIHLVFLATNVALTSLIRFSTISAVADRGIRRAVILCSSQKTLPIAIAVIGQLGEGLGPGAAYAAIACVAAHLIQTVFDSGLVSWWLRRDAAALEAETRAV